MSRESWMAGAHARSARHSMGSFTWAHDARGNITGMQPHAGFDLAAAYETLFSLAASLDWLIEAVENVERVCGTLTPGPSGTSR